MTGDTNPETRRPVAGALSTDEAVFVARVEDIIKRTPDEEERHALIDDLMRSVVRAMGMVHLAKLLSENAGPWFA